MSLHVVIRRALAPVERFLAVEAASGILLLVAAAVALVWANSPWAESYAALLHVSLGARVGGFAFARDVHFWINDGLMTLFFFVVGLEIRREIHEGELSDLRRAALPLVAAIGGMLVPAGIFAALNFGKAAIRGWGIPMATDIAFAVGVLSLLGSRVPPALRVLLLALAVIDDIGAILVIAVFYSTGLEPGGLLGLCVGFGGILVMQRAGVRSPWLYVPAGAIAWAGAYQTGVHPTLAGVAIGLMTPVRVAERLQHALHGWVAFGAMPIFALANAGVPLGQASLTGDARWLFVGVAMGLVAGKPIGVLGASWLAVRLGWAALPRGITWPKVFVVGAIAGIGFTMSIFIAGLAFPGGADLETAKLAILVGSAVAALLGYGLGRLGLLLTAK